MLLRIEPLRNELKSLESEAAVSEAKVSQIHSKPRIKHVYNCNFYCDFPCDFLPVDVKKSIKMKLINFING